MTEHDDDYPVAGPHCCICCRTGGCSDGCGCNAKFAPPEPSGSVEEALASLRALVEEVQASHRDPNSADYNQCEQAECAWCEDSRKALNIISTVRAQQAEQIEELVSVLKAACDRDWTDETPINVAHIAANAIHWRDTNIAALRTANQSLLAEFAQAMAVLKPNMPESGLVDACKQVKQVAISEADNAEQAEATIIHLRSTIDRLDCAQREGGGTKHCRFGSPCTTCRVEVAEATITTLEAEITRLTALPLPSPGDTGVDHDGV